MVMKIIGKYKARHYPNYKKLENGIKKRINALKYLIKHGTIDFFGDINIEINTDCNRACKYCPNSNHSRSKKENRKLMDEHIFKKIINELSDLRWSGRISPQFYGEPLLDKRIFSLMGYAHLKLPKARLLLISNGDYLDIKTYKKLKDSGVSKFLITQHGKTVSPAMRELLKYLKQNSKEMDSVSYSKRDDSIPMYNRGGLVNPKIVDYYPRCRLSKNPVVIDYDGNVILCCNDYHSSIKFGNVRNKTLLEIWNCFEYRNIRRELQKGIYSLPICKKCVGIT